LHRKRDMMRQLRAFGQRRLLFRVVERVERGSRQLPDAALQGSLRELDLDQLAAHAYQRDLRVAPGDPSGLVTLTGVTRAGIERLAKLGLEACCVVRGPLDGGRVDAWVQLAGSQAEVEAMAGPGMERPARLLLTIAAQRLTALAGGDPRVAHYAQGGYVAGVYQAWSQGEAVILDAVDRMASASADFVRDCAARAAALVEAVELAAAAGVDPERENELLASTSDLGVPLPELYHRHAAIARSWGVTDAAALDRSVAAAAARLGAPSTRIRALLSAGSPLAGRPGFTDHVAAVVKEVYADPSTIYAASRARARADRVTRSGESWADFRGVHAAVAAGERDDARPLSDEAPNG